MCPSTSFSFKKPISVKELIEMTLIILSQMLWFSNCFIVLFLPLACAGGEFHHDSGYAHR